MKDFAKSVVCNAKAEVAKVGNAPSYKGVSDQELKNWIRMCEQDIREYEKEAEKYSKYTDTPYGKSQYKHAMGEIKERKEKIKWMQDELDKRKTGNAIPDDMINGPAAAEIRETAGKVYKKEMMEDDLARATAFELAKKYKNFQKSSTFMETIKDVLKKFKTGNSKVGNSDIYSGTYIIMGDDGDVWFRDEHEDTPLRNIDSWAQKKIAEYQRSIDEIKKGVQEAKQAAKKFGLL